MSSDTLCGDLRASIKNATVLVSNYPVLQLAASAAILDRRPLHSAEFEDNRGLSLVVSSQTSPDRGTCAGSGPAGTAGPR